VVLTTHLMEEAERLCDRVAIIEHGRVIDVDTPRGLVARHCPERIVVVTTGDASARERFLALAGVETVDADGPSMTIRGRNPNLVPDVIQCVSRHGIVVTDFHTTVPSLKDVFLRLTGHSIRD
jgi:ABC-2 type transport system ATP-binding protein